MKSTKPLTNGHLDEMPANTIKGRDEISGKPIDLSVEQVLNILGISQIDNRVIVKQASDFGVIDSSKQYFIDGLIDMGTTELTIPAGGIFLAGLDYFLSGLYSTEDNYTMFKTASGIPCSNFRAKELNFWASGTGSKLFDLTGDGNGAIEFNSCNKGDFAGSTTSGGELTSFRQYRTNDTGFFLLQDGFTFNGTWSGGFRIGDSIALATIGTMTLFKEGINLTFGARSISDGNFGSLNNTTTVFDFREENFLTDGGFQLNGAAFNPVAPAVPNISEASTKAFFKDCVGIQNTRPGYEMEFTNQAVTLLTLNTPTKALGETTTLNAEWWEQTANNEVTYLSTLVKDYKITVNVVVDGGPNDDIAVIVQKLNSAGTVIETLKTKVRNVSNVVGGLDVASYSFVTRGTFNFGEKIRIDLENQTDGTDATMLDNESQIFVEVI